MKLPEFKYHPDPISTGAIKADPAQCDCCGQSRGFVYVASFYSTHRGRLTLCPWCIASGEAAKKYDGYFSDDRPLLEAGIAEDSIREVCERTPGYVSWQQEIWQTHCNDACEFHGDAEPAELRALSQDALAELLAEYLPEDEWRSFVEDYEKGGDPAVYKFVCRHCHKPVYNWDCS